MEAVITAACSLIIKGNGAITTTITCLTILPDLVTIMVGLPAAMEAMEVAEAMMPALVIYAAPPAIGPSSA